MNSTIIASLNYPMFKSNIQFISSILYFVVVYIDCINFLSPVFAHWFIPKGSPTRLDLPTTDIQPANIYF